MLRTLFVALIALAGVYYSFQSAFYNLLFYLWLAYFRPETWVWTADWLYTLNLSFLCGVALLLRAPLSYDMKFRVDLRAFLLIGFLLLVSLSSALSPYYHSGGPTTLLDFVKAIIISYLLYCLTTDTTRLRLVIITIAFSLGLEGAKQGWANLFLHPGGKNLNELPQLGDNNGVAVGMLMLAPLFIALAQTAARKNERLVHRFFFVGVIYRGISTYSRGGFVAAGALAVMYVLRSQHKVRAFVAACLVAGVVLPVLPQEFWDRMGTISTSAEEIDTADTSSRSRIHFWEVAVRIAGTHPVLGIGYDAFPNAYDDYDFSLGTFGKKRAVHSIWFGILSETGILGFLMYLFIVGQSLWTCQTVATRARKGLIPSDLGQYAVALQVGLVVFVTGGSFLAWQYVEMPWHFFALTMALRAIAQKAAAPAAISTEGARKPFTPRLTPAFQPTRIWRRA